MFPAVWLALGIVWCFLALFAVPLTRNASFLVGALMFVGGAAVATVGGLFFRRALLQERAVAAVPYRSRPWIAFGVSLLLLGGAAAAFVGIQAARRDSDARKSEAGKAIEQLQDRKKQTQDALAGLRAKRGAAEPGAAEARLEAGLARRIEDQEARLQQHRQNLEGTRAPSTALYLVPALALGLAGGAVLAFALLRIIPPGPQPLTPVAAATGSRKLRLTLNIAALILGIYAPVVVVVLLNVLADKALGPTAFDRVYLAMTRAEVDAALGSTAGHFERYQTYKEPWTLVDAKGLPEKDAPLGLGSSYWGGAEHRIMIVFSPDNDAPPPPDPRKDRVTGVYLLRREPGERTAISDFEVRAKAFADHAADEKGVELEIKYLGKAPLEAVQLPITVEVRPGEELTTTMHFDQWSPGETRFLRSVPLKAAGPVRYSWAGRAFLAGKEVFLTGGEGQE